MSRPSSHRDEPIAVVGVGCRFPDADQPHALWQTVLAQRRAFRAIPTDRLTLADYAAQGVDSLLPTSAGLLDNFSFDRQRFKTSAQTFRSADISHWLALDVADAALIDAGYHGGKGLPRETTGVIVGNTLTGEVTRAHALRLRWPFVKRVTAAVLTARGFVGDSFASLLDALEKEYKRPFPEPDVESLAGGLANTIAGRICNQFGLNGGGYVVDAACASSLLAISRASATLASGEWDVAIAGGVDVSLDPFELVGFSRLGALAVDEMRIFDVKPTGFFPGEGCGFVVLMRYDDAIAEGRRIYALIRGWGVSADGGGSITRPESRGQRLAIERAYESAGVDINSVALFEAHGSGTAVGDAVELTTLLAATAHRARSSTRAAIGSYKANVGHTKAAAGVGGLLKAIMALHSQTIPPTTGCNRPNRLLYEDTTRLRVMNQAEAWPRDLELLAGVSAFGFGGINTHIVIEGISSRRSGGLSQRVVVESRGSYDAELFVLSAADPAELTETVDLLRARAPQLSIAQLRDLAHSLSARTAGPTRAMILASSGTELAARLALLRSKFTQELKPGLQIDGGVAWATALSAPRIGFLFSGQGSLGVAADSPWRRLFDLGDDLSASVDSYAERATTSDGATTDHQQNILACCWLTGLRILGLLDVSGALAIGHSVGELGALHWAGACSAGDLRDLVAKRGRAMTAPHRCQGGMLSLECSVPETRRLIDDPAVGVACENASDQTIVSGPIGALEAWQQRLQQRGILATRLDVADAFHSPLMEEAQRTLAPLLQLMSFDRLSRAVFSSITGDRLSSNTSIATLLARQLCDPVRFSSALQAAERSGVDLWVEIGPGHVLSDLVRRNSGAPAMSLDVLGNSTLSLLRTLGCAFVIGGVDSVARLHLERGARQFDFTATDRPITNPCESAPRLTDEQDTRQRATVKAASEVTAATETLVSQVPAPMMSSPSEVVRRLLAHRLELDPSSIDDSVRLLADLHLNSITISQLAVEAALELGLEPPLAPNEFASTTVAQFAAALTELPKLSGIAERNTSRQPAGLGSWVRAFETVWRPIDRATRVPVESLVDGNWTVVGSLGLNLQPTLTSRLQTSGSAGVALIVPPVADFPDLSPFLLVAQAVAELKPGDTLLVLDSSGWAGGFARSLHMESRGLRTCIVRSTVTDPASIDRIIDEVASNRGFVEVDFDARGRRLEPVLIESTTRSTESWTLESNKVVWVIGGALGIGVECGAALAEEYRAALVVSGRGDDHDDPAIALQLERLRRRVRSVTYVATDITSLASIRASSDLIEREVGPIGAVLHAAGINQPVSSKALDEAQLLRTTRPKWEGMRNLTAAFSGRPLQMLVTFGSVIARTGMPGESHYALANEGLVRATERFAVSHPECRCLALEWSVWSGVGMGERLGSLDALQRAGISPIGVDEGTTIFKELATGPVRAIDLVICGRLGDPLTLRFEARELPFLRFLESPRVYYPGIELVADAEVSLNSDPYFADHALQGIGILPAVIGLEALAQAVCAMHGAQQHYSFEQVEFSRPVTLPSASSRTLRLLALAHTNNTTTVALRSSETHFAVDHLRAVFRTGSAAETDSRGAAPSWRMTQDPAANLTLFDPDAHLYGISLFQAGRFRRLKGYEVLSARTCRAEVPADGTSTWFARDFPPELLLGDPGARDAALHALQACVPHARVLPISVERVETSRLATDQPHWVQAIEQQSLGDGYLFDLEILDRSDRVLESWKGLRLRQIEPVPVHAWSPALLGPYIERRVGELLPQSNICVQVEDGPSVGGNREESQRIHRPDGRPVIDKPGYISFADTGDLRLLISSRSTVGCDVEPAQDRSQEIWRGLLGVEGWRLALILGAAYPLCDACTLVWAARESLRKVGLVGEQPLSAISQSDDGWAVLSSGRFKIPAFVMTMKGAPERIAVAIAVEG